MRYVRAFAFVGLCILALSCSRRPQEPDPIAVLSPPVKRITVDRIDDETIRIRWPVSFSTGSVSVYTGPHPNEIDHEEPAAVGSGGAVVLGNLDDDVPHYFELVPDIGGTSVVVSERRLPLEGALNFRDLGGYRTSDGRQVQWGRLFRADSLAKLTPADLDYLSAIGIQMVCDFRSDQERSDDPSRFDADTFTIMNLPVSAEGVDPTVMRRKIRTGAIVQLELERTMEESYRSFVTNFSDDWAAMFRFLSEDENLPAVVHCTKGKDRTGFASALVLLTLGVPEDVVFEDYLLSNKYLASFSNFVLRWVPLYSFFRTDPDDLLPLLEARRSYLEASLDTIRERYGSVDAYVQNELGVTPARRELLRANLLTPLPAPVDVAPSPGPEGGEGQQTNIRAFADSP